MSAVSNGASTGTDFSAKMVSTDHLQLKATWIKSLCDIILTNILGSKKELDKECYARLANSKGIFGSACVILILCLSCHQIWEVSNRVKFV